MQLIYALALFISTVSFAAQPGAVPSVTISASGANTAQVSVTPAQLSGPCTVASSSPCFSLYGYANSSGGGFFYVLYRAGAAYSTGATTKAYCFDITAASSTGSEPFQLVSSHAAITNNSNTALTNPAYQGGATGTDPSITGPNANLVGVVPGTYVFGDGVHATFAGFQTRATSITFYLHMDCFEQ
jgi:hypothetical protein